MTDISQALEALRQEIKALNLSAEQEARLDSLFGKFEAEELSGQEFSQELPNLLERFETEHPTLTQVLNQVMVSLGNMGI